MSAINYTALATGALGFTVALAWNDAINRTIKSIFPPADERAAARATLAYALVVTILVILVVAAINCAKRIIHRVRGGADAADSERRRARFPTGGPPQADCGSCAERCGFGPVVRLWEPQGVPR